MIFSVYAYYCGTGEAVETAMGFVMGIAEYNNFLRDCEIPDEDSRHCRTSDLDTIFISTNFEDKPAKFSEQAMVNANNVDRALMRFEFLQALVRLAIAKKLKAAGRRKGDISEALRLALPISPYIFPISPLYLP